MPLGAVWRLSSHEQLFVLPASSTVVPLRSGVVVSISVVGDTIRPVVGAIPIVVIWRSLLILILVLRWGRLLLALLRRAVVVLVSVLIVRHDFPASSTLGNYQQCIAQRQSEMRYDIRVQHKRAPGVARVVALSTSAPGYRQLSSGQGGVVNALSCPGTDWSD